VCASDVLLIPMIRTEVFQLRAMESTRVETVELLEMQHSTIVEMDDPPSTYLIFSGAGWQLRSWSGPSSKSKTEVSMTYHWVHVPTNSDEWTVTQRRRPSAKTSSDECAMSECFIVTFCFCVRLGGPAYRLAKTVWLKRGLWGAVCGRRGRAGKIE
jgi:hypothetical protein